MFKKNLVKENELYLKASDDNSRAKLEYYLIESEIEETGDFFGMMTYGAEVVKRTEGKLIESELVRNFSFDREAARKVLDRLASNAVTPVSLTYVIDDMVGM